MQVKGEAIEEYISDKEATYQSNISYQCCISTTHQISAIEAY
jgi:hypothetical protein